MFLFECYAVTMLGNIFLHPLLLLCPNMEFHQSSCAHTPQQNGVAEPCYLINRMPSSILHDQIPHSLLFPTQPLYFLPPHVFGCTCFVHTLTPGQDKLSTKATKCIFLGYSRLQKGYRCYSLDTHRYILSFDVTFFEDSPFFSSSESLPISKVYHRQHRAVAPPLSSTEVLDDSPLVQSISPTPTLSSIDHLPIALRKVGCRWVYTVKVCPDGQLDIKNALLHGELLEEVYMEQSPGFVAQGESSLACKLRRSLYGLKQSPRAWSGHFSSVVQEFGMLRSEVDHSVFYHHNSSSQCIYLAQGAPRRKVVLEPEAQGASKARALVK
ncbi:Retrovirus-related Pol polyprotein from transposon TNT 1-94 [Vitis vinifera]|uniref:Retrovirus-related Pol polyprotein from transposon TNT 1-94 n=1 Tax=Vitis vinifera TaxID=29760 RepID=A0A438EZI2_VITVI|nr:Retrovirus-related Pol polyprotein from transposon TNT 1-94 [Vitis vinifera]